jgi:DNA-binding transcriptional MerR regulator
MSVTEPSKTLRIGALAVRAQRSVHTIRWYEAQGLIPGVMRDTGGRRVYSERHLSWLELIERLRLTGMSIAQLREFTLLYKQGKGSIKQQQLLLSNHRKHVQDTIAEWTQALALLDRKIDFYDEWLSTGERPRSKSHDAPVRPNKKLKGRRSR